VAYILAANCPIIFSPHPKSKTQQIHLPNSSSMMAHKYWNFFILISTLSIQVQWTTAQGQDNLGEMLGGFLEGMKEALGQIQKPGACN
jgi:hypothetical protein